MQMIDRIVAGNREPSSGNVLWVDSKGKQLKYLGAKGWEALGDETHSVEEVTKDVATLQKAVQELQSAVENGGTADMSGYIPYKATFHDGNTWQFDWGSSSGQGYIRLQDKQGIVPYYWSASLGVKS